MIRRVIIDVGSRCRLAVYPEGGLDLETWVDGPGWVLDNQADVSDCVTVAHLESAIAALDKVRAQLARSFAAMKATAERA